MLCKECVLSHCLKTIFQKLPGELIGRENDFERVFWLSACTFICANEDGIKHTVSTSVNGLDTVGELLGRGGYEEMRYVTSRLLLTQKGGNLSR